MSGIAGGCSNCLHVLRTRVQKEEEQSTADAMLSLVCALVFSLFFCASKQSAVETPVQEAGTCTSISEYA